MDENQSKTDERGCFQWVLNAGRTINERWAKSRNRLRARFHRNHPDLQPIRACDLLNDTGTPDMHLVKVPVAMDTSNIGSPDNQGEYNMLMKNARLIHSDEGLSGQRMRDGYAPGQPERALQDMHDISMLYVADSIHGAESILEIQTGCGDISQSVKDSESYDFILKSNLSDYDSVMSVHGSNSWNSSILSDAAEATVNLALGIVVAPDARDDAGEMIETDVGEGRGM